MYNDLDDIIILEEGVVQKRKDKANEKLIKEIERSVREAKMDFKYIKTDLNKKSIDEVKKLKEKKLANIEKNERILKEYFKIPVSLRTPVNIKRFLSSIYHGAHNQYFLDEDKTKLDLVSELGLDGAFVELVDDYIAKREQKEAAKKPIKESFNVFNLNL